LSEQPESQIADDEMLLRRAAPRSLQPATGAVRHTAFQLRAQRGERSLSFYAASRCDAQELLSRAPGPGWGLVQVPVGQLRSIGFSVTSDMAADATLGRAHVSVMPPEYDEDGQIPMALRLAIAAASQWLVQPDASFS
jgi:hypothetical protein